MGKDFESWVRQWHPDGQFPNVKSSKLPLDLGMQNAGIPCAVPLNCPLPSMGFSGLPDVKQGLSEKPHGWFSCLPQFKQGVIPNSTLKLVKKTNLPSKVPGIVDENCVEVNSPIAKNFCAPKQFLVFDQSGTKTTIMMFSSGIGTPIQLFNSLSPKATTGYCNVSGDEIGMGSCGNYLSGPDMTDELDEGRGRDEGSEMHEDTEEIDAFLYSDDDDNYIEDGGGEETSTGHSPPSTVTAYEKQDWLEEDGMDEVASSYGPPTKRKKLCAGSYEAPSVTKAESSVKPDRSFEYEDDAQSSCAVGKLSLRNYDMGSLSANKRSRKEKLRETVSILQTIIPGGKGKDAVMVLDEAIDYLSTLRFKAQSLGLSAL